MIRIILGVIIGYVVMFAVSFVTLSATYMMLGQDRTFQIGSYQLTPLWLMFNAVFALAAAVIAGKVCRVISGSGVGVYVMALSVLVLSLALAVPVLAHRLQLTAEAQIARPFDSEAGGSDGVTWLGNRAGFTDPSSFTSPR